MPRTTVDLPDFVHAQVKRLAAQQGDSVSYTIAGLVSKGIEATMPAGSEIRASTISGLPVLHLGVGQPLKAADVLALADEDD